MLITVASTAGFCFGVDRAVGKVYDLIAEGKRVAVLGELIHNPQVIDDLKCRGVRIIDSIDEVIEGETLVIRTHGVGAATEREALSHGIDCVNLTCPFVKKIHSIVSEKPGENSVVLIAGDENHPEVEGIVGHCKVACKVFADAEQLEKILKNFHFFENKSIYVVSQTTFSVSEWEKCVKKINFLYTNAIIFDTICNATQERQEEARKLSLSSDAMLIIGGRHSSNTAKLKSVCEQNCKTFLVENADEVRSADLSGCNSIGVTAGASTPAVIIKEVLQTMSENQNENQVSAEIEKLQTEIEQALESAQEEAVGQESSAKGEIAAEEEAPKKSFEEMTFQEALEESLKSMSTDQKVRGVVVGITPSEIQVDIGRKQAGYVPVDEYSSDPNADPSKELKIGDEIDLIIMKTNDAEGTMMLSKRRFDATKAWVDVCDALDSTEVLEGTVCEVIKGGVLVSYKGIRVFVPASHATASREEPLEGLLRQKVNFKIIDVNKQRRRAVGSIRLALKDGRKEKAKEFWENAAEGQVLEGIVKSMTSYGAFVDIGGVDGMVHISELSWKRIKHPSDVLNIGDKIEVFIKKLDPETKKISLGYKKIEDNPWEVLRRDYPTGTVVNAKVVGLTTFGAFANIIPGIDGLIHISQIADHHIQKPDEVLTVGDEVTAKITDIDFDKKRVSLSIRALIEPTEEPAADEEAATAEAEEAPAAE